MRKASNILKQLFLFSLLLSLSLSGCGQAGAGTSTIKKNGSKEGIPSTNTTDGSTGAKITDLQYLCKADGYGCATENGYYYLTQESKELKNGAYAMHLMYMDFASRQEIYLCSNSGCNHDTPDCPSVFLSSDFPITTRLFLYNNQLYILSKEPDQDGSMSSGTIADPDNENIPAAEEKPAVLYRAELDGTNRQKIYTFDTAALEDFVLGDDSGIYVVAKKISVTQENGASFSNAEEKKLLRIDRKTKKAETVCSLIFDDDFSWNIQGCFKDTLVLNGTDYGRKLSNTECFDDDAYKQYYEASEDVYALLDLKTGEKKEVFRIANGREKEHSSAINANMLYLACFESGQIKSIDLLTGEEKELAALAKGYIHHMFGDVLCLDAWEEKNDSTFYYLDINTGNIQHSKLVNKSLGWSLEFRAELAHDILVVYDYDAVSSGDDSWEINQYKYALISKEDLYAGNDNFRPIKMIEKGEY